VWLCGKHLVGPDVEAVVARVDADAVVCLNERHELAGRYDDYVAWLAAGGASGRAVWFPIPDLHAPDAASVAPLLDTLVQRVTDGDRLVVHCGAGKGRAGTIAAALLLRLGTPLDDAISTVASARPGAGPEAGAQLDLLRDLSRGRG
jgi:hypothetical protein